MLGNILDRFGKNNALKRLKNENEFLQARLAKANTETLVKITERQQFLFRVDLQMWRQAHQQAIDLLRPRYEALINVYEETLLDTFVFGKVQTRILNVLNTPFKVQNDALEKQDTETNLLNRKWFFDLLKEICLSLFYGYSFIELHFDKTGLVQEVQLVPRQNCLSRQKSILPDLYGETAISIADNPNYLIVSQNDLGLLLKVAPFAILKRHAKAFWSRFQELFGMPFRYAKYTGNDSRVIDTLYENLKEMGSAAFGVFPQGAEIGFLENAKSDAYSVFLEAIKQANEEISQCILGVPASQTDKGSYARDRVAYEKESDLNFADLRMVQFVINDQLFPILNQWGYDFEGLQFVFDPAWKLPLASTQLEVDKWIAENFEISEEYITETYGVPVKKKTLMVENFAISQPFDAFELCCSHEPNVFGGDIKIKEIIEQIIEKIYKGELLEDLFDKLPLAIQQQLLQAIQQEFPQIPKWESHQNNWLIMQSNNIYAFSAAKSFAQLKEMRDLVFKDGKIRPYTEFRTEALKIHQKYNEDWLKTEYEAVKRGAVMGKKWLNIERDKDIYPYLRYETAGDSRVREAHQKLNGMVLHVNSPVWNIAYPLNDWNCRCTVKQLRKDQVSKQDISNIKQNEINFGKIAKDTIPEYWRKNIGKTEIFEQNQTAYFKAIPKDKLLDPEKHYNLPSFEKIYKRGNLPTLKTQNKADYQAWWNGLLQKYNGNKTKNYFDIPVDLGGIQLPIRFDNDFFKHIQKENRETWANNLEDILEKPSEVWAKYENGKKRNSLLFFKFYDKHPVVLNVELTKNGWLAQTVFANNKSDFGGFTDRRKGLLVKR